MKSMKSVITLTNGTVLEICYKAEEQDIRVIDAQSTIDYTLSHAAARQLCKQIMSGITGA